MNEPGLNRSTSSSSADAKPIREGSRGLVDVREGIGGGDGGDGFEFDVVVTIDSPLDGATLTGPRLGSPVVISGTAGGTSACNWGSGELTISQGADVYKQDLRPVRAGPAGFTWSFNWRAPKSGEFTVGVSAVLKAKSPAGKYVAGSSDASVTVTVSPTDRQPFVSVVIDDQTFTPNGDPPAIGLPVDGGVFPVEVITAATGTTQSIKAQVTIDGQALAPVPLGVTGGSELETVWRNDRAIVLRGPMAPCPSTGRSEPALVITDTDWFGVATPTSYAFHTLDITPPRVSVDSPEEGFSFVVPPPADGASIALVVRVAGSVEDTQAGIDGSTLRLSGVGAEVAIAVPSGTDKYAFSTDVTITDYAPYRLIASVQEPARGPNGPSGLPGSTVRNFRVVQLFKPRTLEELLGPRAYLESLLNFAIARIVTQPGSGSSEATPLQIGDLKTAFVQDFGRLIAPMNVDAETPACELLTPVRVLRHARSEISALAGYHRSAYETLLLGLGTSFRQMRGLRTLSDDQRLALATRLGLQLPPPLGGDRLTVLLAPTDAGTPGTDAYDKWLSATFGLPNTFLFDDLRHVVPLVLAAQRECISLQWKLEDSARSQPDLDPDLVDATDLAEDAQGWRDLLAARNGQLDSEFRQRVEAADLAAAIEAVLPNAAATLGALEQKAAAGYDIATDLAALSLDASMFRALLAYARLASSDPGGFSTHEREDLAHLLTQLSKVRMLYPTWSAAEADEAVLPQRLWPSTPATAAWTGASYRRSFWPWRANVEQRLALETRLRDRVAAWQEGQDAIRQAVLETQQAALPALRDGLVGVVDDQASQATYNELSERWLLDIGAGGTLSVAPVEQAVLSMQTLIEGVRARNFEGDHPASLWRIDTKYLTPDVEGDPAPFDLEWGRISTYASWRNAVLNYLYPENVLYPDLLGRRASTGFAWLKKVTSYIDELAKLQPLTPSSFSNGDYHNAWIAVTDPSVWKDAGSYFVPVALGLAYQRNGQHALALDRYRAVFDWGAASGSRAKVEWLTLRGEAPNNAPVLDFSFAWPSSWALRLDDPHTIAMPSNQVRWGQPYTRFVLFQVLECLLAQADDVFASGTAEGRSRALALYLEADDVLNLEELQDKLPVDAKQAYLPSPVLAARRDHVESALRKLRHGLSYLGTPWSPDSDAAGARQAASSLVRPTPYRFRVLMDRGKQLVAVAQQFESQYLSAIERSEVDLEKLLSAGFAVDVAGQTVQLKELSLTEAGDSTALARLQLDRAHTAASRYQAWIDAGPTQTENNQIDFMWKAKTARDVVAGLDAALTASQAAQSAMTSGPMWWTWIGAAATSNFAVARSITQGFLNDYEARAQVNSIYAAQERRRDEWQLQADLATHDAAIAGQQVTLATDRFNVVQKEAEIARRQRDQTLQMLAFLQSKFTNADFYNWLAGVLGSAYAFFLRLAAATAQQAEQQLAFERQQQQARLIRSDYWRLASTADRSTGSSDRRGITGTARLLQDLYALDQRAFQSERRLLNLTQAFSLARLMPVEFEDLRRTGSLSFATPMQWFDDGFPGHLMRLIKRVRVSVAALIPPTVGIRATLWNKGLSRVATQDPGYPTVILRQEPQSVALTLPSAATGVFEQDAQTDLLLPFEGTGVDTTWLFELPLAANPFDFQSLFDVVMTVDYTALFSPDLRDKVLKSQPRTYLGTRLVSARRDLPDTWYAISNGAAGGSVELSVAQTSSDFPPGISSVSIKHVLLAIRRRDAAPCDFLATLSLTHSDGTSSQGVPAESIGGIVSTRRNAAWRPASAPAELPAHWTVTIENSKLDSSRGAILDQLENGELDDILMAFTFEGGRPAWT